MDIQILRNFLAVTREENITRAAESLHISQPSLSKQLMELEKELGKQLMIRGKRKISLTEDGVLLRKRAEEIIALVEKTEQEIRIDTGNISGDISIGGSETETLLHAAAALRRENPNIRFHFYSSDATDVSERLDHGTLDFAVLLEPIDPMKHEYISLKDAFRWGLLMPAHSPLAEKDFITGEELQTLPLIIHRRPGLQREIANRAKTEPEQLNITATYNVVNGSPLHFVQSGIGYFLTSEDHIAGGISPEVCFRPLFPPLELHHALVWKRHQEQSRAAKAYLEKVRETLKK